MKIVVLGVGAVGSTLAKLLSQEDNDVVVVDEDPQQLSSLEEDADIRAVHGKASHPNVLVKADIKSADMVVAVTGSDETNIVACLISKVLSKSIKTIAIMSKDTKNYPEDSFENLVSFSKKNGFIFPYLIDETQEVAKKYGAVCTPDFFGYNNKLELQYRGRIKELKDLKPVSNSESDLLKAMHLIVKTGKGPKNQIPSMGCNIKWTN